MLNVFQISNTVLEGNRNEASPFKYRWKFEVITLPIIIKNVLDNSVPPGRSVCADISPKIRNNPSYQPVGRQYT